jgi:hypothetical protein
MIKPTIGRVVWFHPGAWDHVNLTRPDPSQPLAALVVYVWSDRMVNLAVFDQNGIAHGRTSVPLVQEGDMVPAEFFAEWMPFQKGQAAKAEALEAKVAEGAT